MAREYTPDFIEENDNSQGPATVPTAPGTQGSIPQTSQLADPKTQRKASSGFTNLKKYIQANKDNRLSQSIVQPVESKLQGAQQNLNQSQSAFQNQLADQKAKIQTAENKAKSALGYLESGSQPLLAEAAPQIMDRPNAPTDTWAQDYQTRLADYEAKNKQYLDNQKAIQDYGNQARLAAQSALMDVKNYTYGGPTQLENRDKIAADQYELQDFANASKSQTGRGAILQTLFGKGGQYSAGSRNLDNLLLSSNKPALQQLQDLRSKTSQFGEQLKRANLESSAAAGTTSGLVNTAKMNQANAMQNLRDIMKQRLEAESLAANQAAQADVSQVDMDELQKWLPDMTGYEFTSLPGSVQLPGSANLNPGATLADAAAQSPLNRYINLMQNKNFQEYQKVDPNAVLHRQNIRSGGMFHRDWKDNIYGRPNTSQAYVNAESLSPLFKESYQDNTWDSINRDALERRNVLSQVLADNVEQGIMTPKEKQEIQVQLDQGMLEKLKDIPKSGQDAYTANFFGSKNVMPEIYPILDNPKAYGFNNGLEVTNYFGIPAYHADPRTRDGLERFIDYGRYTGTDKYANLIRKAAMMDRLKQLGIQANDVKLV